MTLSVALETGVVLRPPQPAAITTTIDTPQLTNRTLPLLTDLVRIRFSSR
jgi:hypothetical protein